VKVTDLSRKADNSTAAAKSLLEQGHTDNAARAVLLAFGYEVEIHKTHKGVINAFSHHLVRKGVASPVLAVNFKQTKSTCIMADDHCGDSVGPGVARDVVEQAETFVAAMHQIIVSCCAGPVSTIDHGDDQQGRDPQDDLGR
jgi:uncharacterized protein (UPF0332 family)